MTLISRKISTKDVLRKGMHPNDLTMISLDDKEINQVDGFV